MRVKKYSNKEIIKLLTNGFKEVKVEPFFLGSGDCRKYKFPNTRTTTYLKIW